MSLVGWFSITSPEYTSVAAGKRLVLPSNNCTYILLPPPPNAKLSNGASFLLRLPKATPLAPKRQQIDNPAKCLKITQTFVMNQLIVLRYVFFLFFSLTLWVPYLQRGASSSGERIKKGVYAYRQVRKKKRRNWFRRRGTVRFLPQKKEFVLSNERTRNVGELDLSGAAAANGSRIEKRRI